MTSGYLFRKTTIEQARAIAARAAGVSARALACQYGVSVRTIYRAVAAAGQEAVRVRVGTWHAEFVLTAEGPVRVTPWHAAVHEATA